ncbi:hypothetical protein JB92DRAFT_1690749 [Gautieria morchelliformis]|nr:hypothetical protein JB92DRAFT_1690749 [Gautieria morchelliformis]
MHACLKARVISVNRALCAVRVASTSPCLRSCRRSCHTFAPSSSPHYLPPCPAPCMVHAHAHHRRRCVLHQGVVDRRRPEPIPRQACALCCPPTFPAFPYSI